MVLAIPLIVILAVLVAYGSAALTRSTSAGFVKWLSEQVLSTIVGGHWIADQIIKAARYVAHELGPHFVGLERTAAAWIASLANAVDYVGRVTLSLPYEFSRFAYWLVRHEIPKLVRALPTAVTKVTHAVTSRVVRIERTIVKLPRLGKAQAQALIAAAVATYVHPYLLPLRWLRAHFAALRAAVAHPLPLPLPRSWPNVLRRLKRLERLTAAGVAAGAVALALGRLGLGWIRCRNVTKAGKRLCGMDTALLDELLLGTVAIIGAASVVEFAKGLQAIEDEAIAVMGKLVREWPA